MKEFIPPEFWQSIIQFLGGTGLVAMLARLVWHTRQAQGSSRKFFSIHLGFELIIALGAGLFADGVMEYFELTGKVKTAGIAALAYLGPGGIEHYAKRYFKKPGKPT